MTFTLALAMCLGFLLPVFSNLNFSNNASAASSLTPLETIVGTDIESMTGSLKTDASKGLGQTPFDTENKRVMEGYSVTPTADSTNQISGRSYSVNPFTVGNNISIFIWIYFPDNPYDNFYDLSIKFSNNSGNTAEWLLNYDNIYDLMQQMSISYAFYGWKQLELVYNDAEKNYVDAGNKTFTSMEISYKKTTEYANSTSNGTLSFYSVFTSSKVSDKTSIFTARDYAYYGFASEFTDAFKNLYIGSTYKLTSISDIFEFVYVGNKNLALSGTQNNLFDWSITLKHYSQKDEFRLGYTMAFDDPGEYILEFNLIEQLSSGKTREVFTAKHIISVMKFTFGIFSSSLYDIDKNSTVTLRFDVNGDFVAEKNYSFKVEDEKIAKIESVEFDSKTNSYYIKVKGLKKGSTKVSVSATGYRQGDATSSDFIESASISVIYNGLSPWILTCLYVLLGVYAVAFVIFVSISFVNARRNIVK